VRSGYNALAYEGIQRSVNIFEELLRMNIVPSAQICGWRVLIDRIPTRMNLNRRGVQLTTS